MKSSCNSSEFTVITGKELTINLSDSVFLQYAKTKINKIQDGRLEPACFSPNYKNFDQLLQNFKNETSVLNPAFKCFLQTSIPSLISIFYAKEGVSRFFVENFLSHSAEKLRRGTLQCFKNFWYRKIVCIWRGGEYHVVPSINFCLTVPKNFVGGPLFQKNFLLSVSKL